MSRIRKKTCYLTNIIRRLDGSKLIKTKIINKKYGKYFKTEFVDSTQNHNTMVDTN
jgi:deoxyribodipyrimidine photolyase